MAETDPLSDFVGQVRDALTHLHDPGHLQQSSLARLALAGPTRRSSGAAAALRQALLDAVESLRPSRDVPQASPRYRTYQILRLRYVEALEIPRILERLSLSRSIYYAGQQHAVEAVASVLREWWSPERQGEEATRARESPDGDWDVAVPGAGEDGLGVTERQPRTNLPIPLTSFVGREREVAEVRRLLGETRLLTLTGAGGCGKSRLATETTRGIVDAYSDGVWLVQLAPVSDPKLVAPTVASVLAIREVPTEPIEATLTRNLRLSHCLLLLDNCEHLLDAIARLADTLLGDCPLLSILTTSRQPLGMGGETILHVPSLSIPPAEREQSREAALKAVLSHDASRLFLDRATSALPSFEPSVSNASAIAEICRRLDGIPLAIELAAARVRALSPDQIETRLDHDFHLLTSGNRTAPPRQQTLKAAIEWSHSLLTEKERILLRRLSVFSGGFTLEAAEGICAGDGIEEVEVVVLLIELADRSLLEADTRAGAGRYRLLVPIREYSWHRLEESGETEEIERRHAAWFTARMGNADDEFYGPRAASWLALAALEADNLRAALSWCLDHDPNTGLLLTMRTWMYWSLRGAQVEGHRWVDEMLTRAPARTHPRALTLYFAASDAATSGDYARATAFASECLSIMRELGARESGYSGDPSDLPLPGCEPVSGWTLNLLGQIAASCGDHSRARTLLEEAVAFGRQYHYAKPIAQSLLLGGYSAWLSGDYQRARDLLDEGLKANIVIEAATGVGQAHQRLAGLACSVEDYPRARAHALESLKAWQSLGSTASLGAGLDTLGYIALREGDREDARRQILDGLRLIAPFGHRPRISLCFAHLASVATGDGDADRAVRLISAAETANPYVRCLLPPDQIADLDACLAEVQVALGEEAFARAWAEGQAMTLEQAVEYALAESSAHC